MNKNSLENFLEEAAKLKVPEHMVTAAVTMMEQNVPKIEVFGQIPADKGLMDVTINIKQSEKSDFYYFNRIDLASSKAKPLDKDFKYLVTSSNAADSGKNLTKPFTSAVQAMEFFKNQEGNLELAIGKFTDKDFEFRDVMATMKDGKVDYVKKEFQQVFYSPVLKNSHYVNRGKGFSVEQAANMIQGRSVHRDDLVSRAGERYQAWNNYMFDEAKDKYGNYRIKQGSYSFDVKKELENYEIKDMDKKEVSDKLTADLKNGNQIIAIVIDQDGEERKLRIEAVPRYSNLNFSELTGKPVARETLKKELSDVLEKGNNFEKKLEKGKNKEMGTGIGI